MTKSTQQSENAVWDFPVLTSKLKKLRFDQFFSSKMYNAFSKFWEIIPPHGHHSSLRSNQFHALHKRSFQTVWILTGVSMQRILLLSLLLVPISTSTLSERTLSDFGSLNLGLWSIDLNEVYDFFASPAVQRNFFIVQTSKVGGNGVEQCCQLFIHVRPSGEFLAFLSAMHSGR